MFFFVIITIYFLFVTFIINKIDSLIPIIMQILKLFRQNMRFYSIRSIFCTQTHTKNIIADTYIN